MKKFNIKNIKNSVGGLLIVAVGLFFFMNSTGGKLNLGTFHNMGPGMFPYILSIITIACGLIIALYDVVKTMKENVMFDIRGVITVAVAFAIFAFFIEMAGIFITTVFSVFVIASAQTKMRFFEPLLVGVGLSIFVWVVFSVGLGMPLHFGPEVLR